MAITTNQLKMICKFLCKDWRIRASTFLFVQRLPKCIKIFATIKSIKFIIFSLSLVIDAYSLCSTEVGWEV